MQDLITRVGLAILFAALFACNAQAQDAAKKVLEELQGKYSAVAFESDGMKLPADIVQKKKYRIDGNQLIGKDDDDKDDPISFTLDLSKSPAWIDFEEKNKDGSVRKTYGIFKFEKGELTICVCDTEKVADRPTAFKTEKRDQFLMVLKKDAK